LRSPAFGARGKLLHPDVRVRPEADIPCIAWIASATPIRVLRIVVRVIGDVRIARCGPINLLSGMQPELERLGKPVKRSTARCGIVT
jgi:hypothetical protein